MKTWKREGYTVEEREFDYNLHAFAVIVEGKKEQIITPDSIEAMEEIITALDAGEDVDGWEDGMGNTIYTEVAASDTVECVHCGERHQKELMVEIATNEYICSDCENDVYAQCGQCGKWLTQVAAIWVEEDNEHYCDECNKDNAGLGE